MKSITLLKTKTFEIAIVATCKQAEKILLLSTPIGQIQKMAKQNPNWFEIKYYTLHPQGERATDAEAISAKLL